MLISKSLLPELETRMKPSLLFLLLTLIWNPAVAAQAPSECVRCHADEARIKALYTPPKIVFKAEQGEG
jgi:hypothetical protein